MEKVKVGIIGASGYAGVELVRLLYSHPNVELVGISSRSYEQQDLSELYPNFYQISSLVFSDDQSILKACDLLFVALPHGYSEEYGQQCIQQGKKMIDLGSDFRLYDQKDYQTWYEKSYQYPELHQNSVYGLSELYHDQIQNAQIVGNPGCYPTSIALALYPLLHAGFDFPHIIIDSKSGASGAGKEPNPATHFTTLDESFAPYKIAQHRHTPEIEQTLNELSNHNIRITFVPHLLPIRRGILSTMYLTFQEPIEWNKVYAYYQKEYQHHKFVRVLEQGKTANLKYVSYSNYCDVSLHIDERTNTLIVVSAIDNMIKGAAGQAIQNMNIMYHFEEDCGLDFIPPSF